MPSNKDRVASYLEDDESQALSDFCKKEGMTASQGVAHLIRTKLIESETGEEKLNYLYDERLRRLEIILDDIKQEKLNHYDDEAIASITSQPKEKVYLWRMGLTKPRGRRILEKLAPYEVREGRWVRKK
jgi:hypothetical protein